MENIRARRAELPIGEPIYSTYHSQGSAGAVIYSNPTIKNWYLGNSIILYCNSRFLTGYTTPSINVSYSGIEDNPYIESTLIPVNHIGGRIHSTIRNCIDDGYYVCVEGMDDYYVKGKSWYHKRHFIHNGLIYAYDQVSRTYGMYAYDSSWIYRKFDISLSCLDRAMRAGREAGNSGRLCGLKAKSNIVGLNVLKVCEKLNEYLDSSFEKYSTNKIGRVSGTVVHDYIAIYLDMIADGQIPYERVDKRVFRLIWDHKNVMLQRIIAIENRLGLSSNISERYKAVVKMAEDMRMMYMSYHIKRRDSLLRVIKKILLDVKEREMIILKEFINIVVEEKSK